MSTVKKPIAGKKTPVLDAAAKAALILKALAKGSQTANQVIAATGLSQIEVRDTVKQLLKDKLVASDGAKIKLAANAKVTTTPAGTTQVKVKTKPAPVPEEDEEDDVPEDTADADLTAEFIEEYNDLFDVPKQNKAQKARFEELGAYLESVGAFESAGTDEEDEDEVAEDEDEVEDVPEDEDEEGFGFEDEDESEPDEVDDDTDDHDEDEDETPVPVKKAAKLKAAPKAVSQPEKAFAVAFKPIDQLSDDELITRIELATDAAEAYFDDNQPEISEMLMRSVAKARKQLNKRN